MEELKLLQYNISTILMGKNGKQSSKDLTNHIIVV